MSFYNRRKFLTTTAGAAGALAVAGALGGPAFAQDKARIRHYWWGNPERDKRTFAVIDIFNGKSTTSEVVGETVGFADYFPKLATKMMSGLVGCTTMRPICSEFFRPILSQDLPPSSERYTPSP